MVVCVEMRDDLIAVVEVVRAMVVDIVDRGLRGNQGMEMAININ